MTFARPVMNRVLSALLLLLIISLLLFLSTSVGAGDAATLIGGKDASPLEIAHLNALLGLNQPVMQRYANWLLGLTHGNLGTDLLSQQPVIKVIAGPLANTAVLAAAALLLYFPITLGAATVSALYRGRLVDRVIDTAALVLLSIPEYVMGTILIVIFVVYVPIAPATSSLEGVTSFVGAIQALLLPAIVLAISTSVYAIRMLRQSLIEVLDSEYVKLATLKGVPRVRRILVHAMPNAMSAFLNVTALNLSHLIGGVVVVEVVFSYPGISSLLVQAADFRDAPLLEGTVLIAAAAYIVANLGADLLSMAFNPRLRSQ